MTTYVVTVINRDTEEEWVVEVDADYPEDACQEARVRAFHVHNHTWRRLGTVWPPEIKESAQA